MNNFASNCIGPESGSAFLLLLVIIIISGVTQLQESGAMASAASSQLGLEADAILRSGWWNTSDYDYNNISRRCYWEGITCSGAGCITGIKYNYFYYWNNGGIQLAALNLSVFQNLERLDLSDVGLQGSIPPEIGNLAKLTFLGLPQNSFSVEIPPSLGNLTHLTFLDLSNNFIGSSIPPEIRHLKNLSALHLSHNKIKGLIPPSLLNLTNLTSLDLSSNIIEGSIPPEMRFLENLSYLDLSDNKIKGRLDPLSLGNLTQLTFLDLSYNNIQGSIPQYLGTLGFLKNLVTLDLSNNLVVGSLPFDLGRMTNLQELRLSNSSISGQIPLSIQSLAQLTTIYLDHNHISGEIPPQLACLPRLKILDLSHNNLSGKMPCSFAIFYTDPEKSFSISYNNLEDLTPDAFKSQTCSTHGKKKSKVVHHLAIVLPVLFSLILAFLLLMYLKAGKSKQPKQTSTKNGDLFSIWDFDGNIAFDDIIIATEDFDMKYCIGTGAYGSVYRVLLPSGKVVALKKLHGFETEEPAYDKSFRNEVKVLSEIKHRNIVKLYGFCLHKRSMFFIYQYMEKGSLFS